MKKVLFLCTHNSARSQMAEALLNHLYGDRYRAYSAGTAPSGVNPYAVSVMAEIGIDISKNRSKSLDEFRGEEFDYVVTLCEGAKESCPFFEGGKVHLHRGFQDPSSVEGSEEAILEAFRRVRDEIRSWLIETFG